MLSLLYLQHNNNLIKDLHARSKLNRQLITIKSSSYFTRFTWFTVIRIKQNKRNKIRRPSDLDDNCATCRMTIDGSCLLFVLKPYPFSRSSWPNIILQRNHWIHKSYIICIIFCSVVGNYKQVVEFSLVILNTLQILLSLKENDWYTYLF